MTDSQENTPTRKRLNLDVTNAAYDLIQTLSRETAKSMADILRIGLALFGIAWEERKKDRKICICETQDGKDVVLKEIALPW